MTIPAAFLTHVGFSISHQPTNWYLVVLVFFVAAGTMVQNDYLDRYHDLNKGKRFAFDNARSFKISLHILWSFLILSGAVVLLYSVGQGILLLAVVVIGIFYTHTRKVLLLSAITTSATSSSPVLFAYMTSGSSSCLIVFFSVFLVIFGREMIKDIEDCLIDIGYKKTLVAEEKITIEMATRLAGTLIFLGALVSLSLFLHPQQSLVYLIYMIGFAFCTGASAVLWFSDDFFRGRDILDRGMIGIILSLSLIPLHW